MKKNTNNRRKKKSAIAAFSRDILNDRWKDAGQPIIFSKSGVLKDGQNRLESIIKSGEAIWLTVCTGVIDDGVCDLGTVRSAADTMKIRKIVDERLQNERYASVARFLINELHKENLSDRGKVTSLEIEDYIIENEDVFIKLADICSKNKAKYFNRCPITVAILSAIIAGIDKDILNDYYSILITGRSTCEEHFPIIAFREWTMKYDLNGQSTERSRETIRRCQYSIMEYAKGSKSSISKDLKKYIYPLER